MNNDYNVIWIDDEYDKMKSFQQECLEIHHINLMPFRTQREGMAELERNLSKWDAVLLDAKMFDETENEVAKLTGLRKAIIKITELSNKKAIPYFISTGQPDLVSDKTFNEYYEKYYIKERDDIELIEDIKKAIEESPATFIKNNYSEVFTSMESLHLNDHAQSIVKDILLALHFKADYPHFSSILYYNQLRQLLEYIFRAYNEVGLIPDDCLQNNIVNLNQCSQYIAGNPASIVNVRYGEPGERIIPKHMEYTVRTILELGNTHSHTVELNDEDLENIKAFFATAHSNHLIFGLTLLMCDFINWSANYIKNHPDKEVNLLYCQKINNEEKAKYERFSEYEGIEFIPEKDENGVWHCGECKLAIKYWTEGRMRLKDIQTNTDNRTNKKYPYFANYDKII